jgi:hypothetical protein
VRLTSFITSPALPEARRNTTWQGLAHVSDWYVKVDGTATVVRHRPSHHLLCVSLAGTSPFSKALLAVNFRPTLVLARPTGLTSGPVCCRHVHRCKTTFVETGYSPPLH